MKERQSIVERPKADPALQIEHRNQNGKDVFLVLNPKKPSWATINQHGLHVLKLCNGNHSIDQISEKIADDTGILQKEADVIVRGFIDQLIKSHLLIQGSPSQMEAFPKRNRFQNLAIEITRQCNLKCRHCFLSAGNPHQHELSLDEIKDVIRQVKKSGGTSVSIGGGEPLLRNGWQEIIQFALSLDLLVALGSNGTIITREISRTISRMPIKIQISIDGAAPSGHDQIRGSGSFNAAMEGLQNLISAGKRDDLVIAFTPMAPNIDEVPAFFDLMLDMGVRIVQFPTLTRSGRARQQWHKLRLTDSQRLFLWRYLSERRAALKGRMDIIADCFSVNIHTPGTPYRCSIGTQLRMDPCGDIYPCQCFHFGNDFLLGNIRKNKLNQIVKGKRLKNVIAFCMDRPNRILSCSKCRWINFCGSGCMGNAYEATGSALQPDRCDVRKNWIEEMFEEEAGMPTKARKVCDLNERK